MHWRKLGIIFRPDTSLDWSRSHAMLPTPVPRVDLGVLRVYYTGCDESGRGRPGYFDLALDDPTRLVSACPTPLLDVGMPGAFDDNGAVATSVVRGPDGRWHMYYVGFELGTRIRYRLLTGLATSEDGASFRRMSRTPVLERSDAELFFRCGPQVCVEDSGFRMWYVAGSRWVELDGKPMPEYRIVHARSRDGINWPTAGDVAIDITDEDEHGFGRPWVMRHGTGYRMFYSIRRRSLQAYRMGYAESTDGVHWTREDARMNLHPGPGTYDDHALMYAAPVEIGGRTWCFYNGNDFGRDGIALALLEGP